MNTRITALVFLFALASLSLTGSTLAQSDVTAPDDRTFNQAELDQMLAPVALYPDALLTQLLTAATYPLEIVEAARWSQANLDLTGTDAVNAVDAQNWDPSVKALLAFPDLLQMMDDKLDWTERLGDAFLAQATLVMDTVQDLRHKAEAAGTLSSGGELRVEDDDGLIDIEPAAADLVYLPYYDPTVVYGTWWWPAYPPVCWTAWPGYYLQGGFAWGTGVAVGIGFFVFDFDWHHHHVNVFDHGRPRHERGHLAGNDPSHVWRHDPTHRRGVAYRDHGLNRQFGRASVVGKSVEFRGHESGAALLRQAAPIARGQAGRADVSQRAQRGYVRPGMQRSYAEPAMRRGYAGPGMPRGVVVPQTGMPPPMFNGGAGMAPARSQGGAEHATQRAPARDAPPSNRHD